MGQCQPNHSHLPQFPNVLPLLVFHRLFSARHCICSQLDSSKSFMRAPGLQPESWSPPVLPSFTFQFCVPPVSVVLFSLVGNLFCISNLLW